mmetsp:Transcript_14510/g.43444  ORF Transcript_14510/g.43444 Transcript_14510/m.43444 type:complete len:257 (-) Transcript_14510:79-849(-)
MPVHDLLGEGRPAEENQRLSLLALAQGLVDGVREQLLRLEVEPLGGVDQDRPRLDHVPVLGDEVRQQLRREGEEEDIGVLQRILQAGGGLHALRKLVLREVLVVYPPLVDGLALLLVARVERHVVATSRNDGGHGGPVGARAHHSDLADEPLLRLPAGVAVLPGQCAEWAAVAHAVRACHLDLALGAQGLAAAECLVLHAEEIQLLDGDVLRQDLERGIEPLRGRRRRRRGLDRGVAAHGRRRLGDLVQKPTVVPY